MDFPASEAMIVNDMIVIEQYSNGPKWMAIRASGCARKTRKTALANPPKTEKNTPAPRALPASPFSAIGPPSKTVVIEDGVPGILSKIALIMPPEIPPT